MIRLEVPRLRSWGLVCPACGRVHGLGRRVLKAGLLGLFLLVLSFSAFVTPGFSKQTGFLRSGKSERVISRPAAAFALLEQEVLSMPTPIPSPGAILIPSTAVVWNRVGAGIYLWDRPDGKIVGYIENGTVVTLTDHWEGYGGVPFGEVLLEGAAGWVDMGSVFRVEIPDGGFGRVKRGAYLYDEPGGRILRWLSPGTPVFEKMSGEDWIAVELLVGGEMGWIVNPSD